MNYIYLQRHGESYTNIESLFTCRKLDPGLTDKGKNQIINKTGFYFNKNIFRIYSSPSLRAVETSKILSEKLNVGYILDEELLEINVGFLEGQNDKISGNHQIFFSTLNDWSQKKENRSFTNGECLADIEIRIQKIKQKYFDSINQNIILVGHAAFFSMILNEFIKVNHIKDLFLKKGGTAFTNIREIDWQIIE